MYISYTFTTSIIDLELFKHSLHNVIYITCYIILLVSFVAFIDLGLLFAFAGTTEHIMTSVKLFRLSVISPARLLWVCNYTVIIMSVWLFGVSRLIGYRDQLQYLSASVPRFTTYFNMQRTKPKSSNK